MLSDTKCKQHTLLILQVVSVVSVIGHFDQNFSQNVLLLSLEIVLILVFSINENPHYNLFTVCLLCTDPYLFPACVVVFMIIFVFVC